jgi:hypothetical protein
MADGGADPKRVELNSYRGHEAKKAVIYIKKYAGSLSLCNSLLILLLIIPEWKKSFWI